MSEVIFTTVHGSNLYGMSRDTSDMDIFEVTNSRTPRARHSISRDGMIDHVSMGLDVFLQRIFEGSHQSVEALFSPFKEWGTCREAVDFRDYLDGFRVGGSAVFAKYERTIKRFCFGDFKRRRHAGRLSLNLADLRCEGKFNPVLSPAQIAYVTSAAETYEGNELWNYLTS